MDPQIMNEFLEAGPELVFARDGLGMFAGCRRDFLEELDRYVQEDNKTAAGGEAADAPSLEFLRRLTQYESRTGLPNQILFYDRMHVAVAAAKRERHRLGVLIIDLDGYQKLIAALGAGTSDRLLREVAERLVGTFRKADTIASPGGGLFLMILPEIVRIEDGLVVARKIVDAFRKPFLADGPAVSLTASVGMAVFPDHGESARLVVQCAGDALRTAEVSGGNRFHIYRRDSGVDAAGDRLPP